MDGFSIKPPIPQSGTPAFIGADLYINDMIAGYATTSLIINGKLIATQQVLVYPDEVTPFHFTHAFKNPGTFTVSMVAEMNPEQNQIYGIERAADPVYLDAIVTVN